MSEVAIKHVVWKFVGSVKLYYKDGYVYVGYQNYYI